MWDKQILCSELPDDEFSVIRGFFACRDPEEADEPHTITCVPPTEYDEPPVTHLSQEALESRPSAFNTVSSNKGLETRPTDEVSLAPVVQFRATADWDVDQTQSTQGRTSPETGADKIEAARSSAVEKTENIGSNLSYHSASEFDNNVAQVKSYQTSDFQRDIREFERDEEREENEFSADQEGQESVCGMSKASVSGMSKASASAMSKESASGISTSIELQKVFENEKYVTFRKVSRPRKASLALTSSNSLLEEQATEDFPALKESTSSKGQKPRPEREVDASSLRAVRAPRQVLVLTSRKTN